ncbi:hypothetical protein KA005_21680, partial [bacterium]|nr:hypothetical protein [bacterium]
MENISMILSAGELRQRIENEDIERTAELKEAAALVLNAKVAKYIQRHGREIDMGEAPTNRCELYATDISNTCASASKEVCNPTSSGEFSFIVETLVKQLESLGYLAVIEE